VVWNVLGPSKRDGTGLVDSRRRDIRTRAGTEDILVAGPVGGHGLTLETSHMGSAGQCGGASSGQVCPPTTCSGIPASGDGVVALGSPAR
jgi:hypothetical protein